MRPRSFTTDPASSLGGYAAVNLKLVQELPLPLAHAADVLASQRNAEAQLDGVIDTFRCATRFLALVALAHNLRDPNRHTAMDGKLGEYISGHLTDGRWLSILRESLRPYARRPHESLLPSLVAFYFHHEAGEKTEAAVEFERWVNFRNELSHPNLAKGQVTAESLAEEWLTSVAMMLQDLSFFSGYELVQPIKVSLNPMSMTSARLFRGPSLNVRYVTGLSVPIGRGVEPEESVLLIPAGRPDQQLLLSPFLVVGHDGTMLALQEFRSDRRGNIIDANYVSVATGRDARLLTTEPAGPRHFAELTRLTAPLGRTGISGEASKPAFPTYRIGENPWRAIERWADAWVRSEHSYDVVLEFDREDDLKAAIDNPDIWTELGRPETQAFVLVIALHYRLSWLHWAEANTKNELAARQLLRMLRAANRYHRPRLRALYALQLFDRDMVTRVLDEGEWPPEDVTLVRRYVLSGRMKDYLRFLATKGPYPLPQKADQVLTEIEPTGVGGIDLPLGPDDDEPAA